MIVSGNEVGAEITLYRPVLNDSPLDIVILDPSRAIDEMQRGSYCGWTLTDVVFLKEDQYMGGSSPATYSPPFILSAGSRTYVELTGVLGGREGHTCVMEGGLIEQAEVELPYRVFGFTKTATVDFGYKIAIFGEPEEWIRPDIQHVNPQPSR